MTFSMTASELKNQGTNVFLETEGESILVTQWQRAQQNCLLTCVESKTCKG